MKTGLTVALASLFCLIAQGRVPGEGTDEVLAILGKIRQRQDSYNPCRVRYRLTTKYTKFYYGALQKIEPADRKLWAELRETSAVHRCDFAQKGDKLLQKSFGGPDKAASRPGQEEEWVTAYDGKLTRTTGTGGKVLAISRKKPTMVNPLSSYNGEKMLLELQALLKTGKFKPTEVRIDRSADQVPGASVHLYLGFDKGTSHDVWLTAEDKGYCVVRLQNRMGGHLAHEFTDCQYDQVDGVYFPRQATWNNYYNFGGVHQLAMSKRCEADSITCRADQVPDSLFEVAVPAGAELIDRDMKNQRVTDPTEVEKYIQKAAEEAGRPPPPGWLKWLYFAGSVLFLLGFIAVVFLVVRSRRRKAALGGG